MVRAGRQRGVRSGTASTHVGNCGAPVGITRELAWLATEPGNRYLSVHSGWRALGQPEQCLPGVPTPGLVPVGFSNDLAIAKVLHVEFWKRANRKGSAMATAELVVGQESRTAIRELDHRAGDGIEVRLLWNAETNDVLVSVADTRGLSFAFQVPPADALDAFHHPYCYATYVDQYIPLAA